MTTTAARIPREKENDHTAALGERRREFLHEQTGVDLEHVGRFSFDPACCGATSRTSSGSAQVPIGVAGPLRINGEHASGRLLRPAGDDRGHAGGQLQPRDAAAHRVRRRRRPTVVDDQMQRAPAFIFNDALQAREFGAWIDAHFDEIKAAAESTTRSGSSSYIGQYQVGPLRYLRFNYTTGDAAGQNMTGKATLAACEWIQEQPSRAASSTSCPARSTPTRSTRRSTCC